MDKSQNTGFDRHGNQWRVDPTPPPAYRGRAKSRVYRTWLVPNLGYCVYRHVFNPDDIPLEVALGHKVAMFVTKHEARDYANYRNLLIDERGTDAI